MADNLSAVEIQQEYFETVGDSDWELYEEKDRKYLLQKVAIALCGPPTIEGDLSNNNNGNLQGYGKRETEISKKVYDKICEQAKYAHNQKNILISILRIVCVFPKSIGLFEKTPDDYWLNLHVKKGKDVVICVFHVFSIRKCIPTKYGATCCKTFIDHDARVYKDWIDYLNSNTLPKGVLIAPSNGEYKGRINPAFTVPRVNLTASPSPALGLGHRILEIADTTSTVVNIGAVGCIGVALAAPVIAPVLMTVAVGAGITTGIYSIARATAKLIDRNEHEQSIGIEDSEARSMWINIIVSTIGVTAGAASKLLKWAATVGTNVEILISAVTFLQYANIASGAVGALNNLVDMIINYTEYGQTPSTLEIFQFTTSILFLGIGVMSNQTAQEIVQDAQAQKINNVRDTLSSNTKRRVFDKVTAETRRLHGTIEGNAQVIKALKTINNKDEFFGKLVKINKQVNSNKVRISLSSDGQTFINNEFKLSLKKLYGLGKDGRNNLFSKYGPAEVNTKNAPTRLYTSNNSSFYNSDANKYISSLILSTELPKIVEYMLQFCKKDHDFIIDILSNLAEKLHNAFLLLCAELTTSFISADIDYLDSIFPDYKIRIVYFIYNYIKSKADSQDDKTKALLDLLKKFIINGKVDKVKLKQLKDAFIQYIREQNERKQNSDGDPNKYDDLYKFRKINKTIYRELRAGQILKVGNHSIVIKAATLEKLEEKLIEKTQQECDSFLEFCFKIISFMNAYEIETLNLINPDEDVLMRIVCYMFNATVAILRNDCNKDISRLNSIGNASDILANYIKNNLMNWRSQQYVQPHSICPHCSGMSYYCPS